MHVYINIVRPFRRVSPVAVVAVNTNTFYEHLPRFSSVATHDDGGELHRAPLQCVRKRCVFVKVLAKGVRKGARKGVRKGNII